MTTTEQIFQAIAAVSEKVNDMSGKLDEAFRLLHDENAANISYLAMMTENDLPTMEEGSKQ
mgnify:CR=1 FL=1